MEDGEKKRLKRAPKLKRSREKKNYVHWFQVGGGDFRAHVQ